MPDEEIYKQILRDIDLVKFSCSHISKGSQIDCETAFTFNSRFLEYLTLKINKIVHDDCSSLCILYPNQKVHYERLVHPKHGVQDIVK